MPNHIVQAYQRHSGKPEKYKVMRRGRPELDPVSAARSVATRRAFGATFRKLREGANLSLSEAAKLINMTSPRKLAQYETTCYPPGYVMCALAPHYGVLEEDMCKLLLSHSDPHLYEGITGRRGYHPTDEEIEIQIVTSEKEAREKLKRAEDAKILKRMKN